MGLLNNIHTCWVVHEELHPVPLLEENSRSRCAHILQKAADRIITWYWDLRMYVETYFDHYFRDCHLLTKEQVIKKLRLCEQKSACWYIHEFVRLKGVINAPPFDYKGPIYWPKQCPLRLDNANCAHGNTLWVMIRALILTDREDEGFYFLKPFLDLMVQDGWFAIRVMMGDQAHIMESNELRAQESVWTEVLKRVKKMLHLLQ